MEIFNDDWNKPFITSGMSVLKGSDGSDLLYKSHFVSRSASLWVCLNASGVVSFTSVSHPLCTNPTRWQTAAFIWPWADTCAHESVHLTQSSCGGTVLHRTIKSRRRGEGPQVDCCCAGTQIRSRGIYFFSLFKKKNSTKTGTNTVSTFSSFLIKETPGWCCWLCFCKLLWMF